MFLPFKQNAIIKRTKIVDYLLSETHVIGRYKSKFFRKIGFNENNIDEFELELLKLKDLEVDSLVKNEYGTKYIIIGEIISPIGKVYPLTTVWMLEDKSEIPYLITSYPH